MLEGFEPEEISHITGILHRHQSPINETALADCVRTIASEYNKRQVTTEDDLMALRNKIKESKGIRE